MELSCAELGRGSAMARRAKSSAKRKPARAGSSAPCLPQPI